MTKNANDEGSVYFDQSKKRWMASVSHRDGAGKLRRIKLSAKTKAKANELRLKMLIEQQSGDLIAPSSMTIGDLLDRYTSSAQVRPTTLDRYTSIAKHHIKPKIGAVKLENAKPLHIDTVLSEMAKAELSGSSRKQARIILNQAFKLAMKWGLINRNPVDAIETPRIESKEFTVLDLDQSKRFRDAVKDDRLEALYIMAIATGMRQGELFGLKWKDIDFASQSLSIRRTVAEVNGEFIVGEPKTKSARRKVSLPDFAVEALNRHRERMKGEGLAGCEFVFVDSQGGFIRRQNLLRRSHYPLLEAAGLPRIRFHDLRHSAATILLAMDVHPKIVQELLGHSKINITLDTYSHVLPSLHKDAASKMDAALG